MGEPCALPKRLNMFTVNNVFWEIYYVEPNSKYLMRSDGSYTLGATDNNVKAVFIANNLTQKMFEKVLCHEIVHTFCFSYDIGFDIETEELIADFLATYGRDVFEVADSVLKRFYIAA